MNYQRANKALHRTAIPLRSIAAGELGRSLRRDEKLVNNDLRSEYDNT